MNFRDPSPQFFDDSLNEVLISDSGLSILKKSYRLGM